MRAWLVLAPVSGHLFSQRRVSVPQVLEIEGMKGGCDGCRGIDFAETPARNRKAV